MRALPLGSLLFVLLTALGCEPEIGGPCDPVAENVAASVEQKAGTDNLVQDVKFDNCSQGLCLSTNGSRPYCTRQCAADIECQEAGPGFTCQEVVAFGPLACVDYEDPLQERPAMAGKSSGAPCETSEDCSNGESCFPAGDLKGTCGFAGRDCLTGDNGEQSTVPLKYCEAQPQTIAERDQQFNRTPTNK